MRPRDLDRLTASTHDILIVGGGIYGLTIAYEAASRGLRVALVEARDFGSGISFNHQKTAHGGLRSLQSGRLDRAREAIRERRALARIAPWLLRPLPFLVGTYRSFMRSRLALHAAFKIDAVLGRDRNTGVEPELHLPAARLVSKAATLRLFPGIKQDGLTGGAQWYDYQMVESDRLTVAFAAAADRAGADLANYVESLAALREGSRVVGIRARDVLSGGEIELRASLVVNAAGTRAGEVMRSFGIEQPFPLVRTINLMTSKPASDMALAAPARDGRMLTLVPWRGRALVGTSQSAQPVDAEAPDVTSADVDAFIAQANEAFPALALTRADVTLVHRGLVPGGVRAGRVDLRSEPGLLDHARDGVEGAFTVIGVKYTTARGVAERAVNMIGKKLGTSLRASRTAFTVLPGAGIADHEALAIETGREYGLEFELPLLRHLIARYAEGAAEIVRLIAARPELRQPLAPDVPTIGAEVVHVIRNEMAVRLSDIIVRRTGLGATGYPGDASVHAAARIAAAELQWDDARVRAEIAACRDATRIP